MGGKSSLDFNEFVFIRDSVGGGGGLGPESIIASVQGVASRLTL